MRKITCCLLALPLFSVVHAQTLAFDSLEVNTLKAHIYSDGGIWEMQTYDDSTYKNLLFADGIWIGGMDGTTLHQSAQTYRQNGLDFKPGPVSNDPNAFNKYNKIYKVNLQTLTDFKNGVTAGIPQEIADWPAHGDTTMGEAFYLAPFVDINQDGIYDPADGDYPQIKGDAAVYTIFNDAAGNTSGTEMGLEIHCMMYGYKTGGIEDSILYKEYRIINRSITTYTDAFVSFFVDFDLGNHTDDLMGTNISANSIFCYNGDSDDEGPRGFGTNLATTGIRILKGPLADYFDGIDNDKDGCVDAVRDANGNCIAEDPATGIREQILLSGSMIYGNSPNAQGNPALPLEYYNYSRSLWKDGNNLIIETPSGFGNTGNGDGYVAGNTGTQTMYVYPGNSIDTTGAYPPFSAVNWFESPANQADKRSLANAGPFTLSAGQEFTTAIGMIWSRRPGLQEGYDDINGKLSMLDSLYASQPQRTVSLPNYQPKSNYQLAYRPHEGEWVILNNEKGPLEFKLYNTKGQLLQTFRVSAGAAKTIHMTSLANGMYLLVHGTSGASHKILK